MLELRTCRLPTAHAWQLALLNLGPFSACFGWLAAFASSVSLPHSKICRKLKDVSCVHRLHCTGNQTNDSRAKDRHICCLMYSGRLWKTGFLLPSSPIVGFKWVASNCRTLASCLFCMFSNCPTSCQNDLRDIVRCTA
jgi:hypothetical protein